MAKKSHVANVENLFADFLHSFNVFSQECCQEKINNDSTKKSLLPCNLSEYLCREERIMTLQREKYEKEMRKFNLSVVEELIFSTLPPNHKDSFTDVVSSLSRLVTRPLLKDLKNETDEYASLLMSLVQTPDMKLSFTFDIPQRIESAIQYQFRKSFSAQESIIGIRIEEKRSSPFTIYGKKLTAHSGRCKNLHFKAGFLCTDLADFLSCIIIQQQVNKRLYLLQTQKESDSLYIAIKGLVDKFRQTILSSYSFNVFPDSKEKCFSQKLEDKLHLPFFIRNGAHLTDYLQSMEKEGIIKTMVYRKNEEVKQWYLQNDTPCITATTSVLEYLPFLYIMESPVPYSEMVYRRSDNGIMWGLPSCIGQGKRGYVFPGLDLYLAIFRLIAEEKYGFKSIRDYYRELSGSYAKSFMLKQNITHKISEAMQASLFNQYFGFVEYDNDVDIAKAEEIAKEFAALWETHLSMIDAKENVIRFRKLGQHKALGLYYPAYGCLCVDIRSPQSLTHEFGHLIDFTHGNLSNDSLFFNVKRAYKERLECSMQNNDDIRKQMNGKSKYNLGYYLTPTEIFARCFELYISKILNVTSSIVPQEFKDAVYPQDDVFMELIKGYFNTLLNNIFKENKSMSVNKTANAK